MILWSLWYYGLYDTMVLMILWSYRTLCCILCPQVYKSHNMRRIYFWTKWCLLYQTCTIEFRCVGLRVDMYSPIESTRSTCAIVSRRNLFFCSVVYLCKQLYNVCRKYQNSFWTWLDRSGPMPIMEYYNINNKKKLLKRNYYIVKSDGISV